MNYTRNTPLFFKKQPSSMAAVPDACFLRDMGELRGERICEIEYCDSPWIVRYSEVTTKEDGMAWLREKWALEIESAKKKAFPFTNKKNIAEVLRISTATLRKRLKFIEENLESK